MTKEEYEKLLKSDYWKGYSYSLIKERGFTCEDCKRSFVNERQKLQVHHLTYRDVNPWSYKPEELVVLCEECHKRRHGIISIPESSTTTYGMDSVGGYSKSYSFDVNIKDEKTNNYSINSKNDVNDDTHKNVGTHPSNPYPYYSYKKQKKSSSKYIKRVLFILLLILGATYLLNKKFIRINDVTSSFVDKNTEEVETKKLPITTKEHKSTRSRKKKESGKQEVANNDSYSNLDASLETTETDVITNTGVAESSISDNVTNNIQEEPKGTNNNEATASELSTSEINDRIYRANVVERAKRAGVSTEGTTSEINDRIYRANVEERARRAGVSTEGTIGDDKGKSSLIQ